MSANQSEDPAAWASVEADRLAAQIAHVFAGYDIPDLPEHEVEVGRLAAAALLAAERRGAEQAAQWVEEPYPESMFPPLNKDEMQYVMSALRLGWPARLHASWARHWAKVIREKGEG